MRSDVYYTAPTDDVMHQVAMDTSCDYTREVIAMGWADVLTAIRTSRERSHLCLVGTTSKGEILGIGGLLRQGDQGIPWAILTKLGASKKVAVVRESRNWIRMWSRDMALSNVLYHENIEALKLVQAIGFTEFQEVSLNGHHFIHFQMARAS